MKNKELFHSVHFSPQHCWKILLWLDSVNFAGVRCKLPNDDVNDTENIEEDNEDEISLEMHWDIAEQLSEEQALEYFEYAITRYVNMLNEGQLSTKVIKEISYLAYELTIKLNKKYKVGPIEENYALKFVNAFIKVLSVDKSAESEILSLRRNMLRLVNVGEFSDLAEWKDNIDSYVLNEVICRACNHCRNLDLLKDKYKVLKNDL